MAASPVISRTGDQTQRSSSRAYVPNQWTIVPNQWTMGLHFRVRERDYRNAKVNYLKMVVVNVVKGKYKVL